MMRMGRWRIALVAGLGVALLAALGILFFQSRHLAELQQKRDADLATLRETRKALREAERRYAAAMARPPAPANTDKATVARQGTTIEQLNRKLNEAHTSITQLQAQLSEAGKENQAKLASANGRCQKLQADWQNRLDTLQQKFDSLQAALQDARQRIAGVEKANARLSSEQGANSSRTAEREQLLLRLQDLDRRREAHLSSIADRCRDITNRFRAMSGMLDSNHDGNSTAFSGAALDLIQNAISLTDDDLRHLSELDAKAFRIQKQLAKK